MARASFKSRDGRITFRVPDLGDPEYTDYLEMLRCPAYQTSAGDRLRLPYDPEWRSMVTGRRDAPRVDAPFTGGAPSVDALVREVLKAVRDKDVQRLHALRVTGPEYAAIFWPEFPQSRPYVKIPVEEAWAMHASTCMGATEEALLEHGGRTWTLENVEIGATQAYRNFRLHDGVKLRVRDAATGEVRVFDWARSIAERGGLYKIFIYVD